MGAGVWSSWGGGGGGGGPLSGGGGGDVSHVVGSAQYEQEFPARGRGFWTPPIFKTGCTALIYQLKVQRCPNQNLVLELETRPRTEPFRSHSDVGFLVCL